MQKKQRFSGHKNERAQKYFLVCFHFCVLFGSGLSGLCSRRRNKLRKNLVAKYEESLLSFVNTNESFSLANTVNRYRKTVSLLLLFSLLQAFAPLVRMASEASCCMVEAKASTAQGCCQKEQAPTQMQCCPGEAMPGLQPSVTPPQVTEKVLLLVGEPSARIATASLFAHSGFECESLSSFNSHLNNSRRYFLSSAFLL